MARISLVICDLCKNQMTDAEGQEEYSVTLSSLNTKETVGEVCTKCFKSLLNRLRSDKKPVLASPTPSKKEPRAPKKAVEKPETNPVGPSEAEKAGREPTEDLLDDEIHKVPSKFNRRDAIKALREMNNGSTCPHHFSSFRDGKVICSDAPPGIEGEHAGFRGCGEVVPRQRYTVSKPRHYAFGKK